MREFSAAEELQVIPMIRSLGSSNGTDALNASISKKDSVTVMTSASAKPISNRMMEPSAMNEAHRTLVHGKGQAVSDLGNGYLNHR